MPSFRRSYPLLLAVSLLLAPACFAVGAPADAEAKPSGSHVHLIVTGAGLLLLAGGGAFAYYRNREADRDMAVYRKSGFTENTSAYRERVEEHQRLTWAGLAGAALGGILVVVSF